MNNGIAALTAGLLLLAGAGPVLAHTGGSLDSHGCHDDRRKGDFHCHHGELRGHSFTSRKAMLEAVESGNLPPRPERRSFFSRWLPGRDQDEPQETEARAAEPSRQAPRDDAAQQTSEPPSAGDEDATAVAAPENAPTARPGPPPAAAQHPRPGVVRPAPSAAPRASSTVSPALPERRRERSFEERLETLQRLLDEGLITREEYQERRRAILDEI
ncbi:MAG TPA: SHOCT domain-containing protein [Candidatus Binatia bacterium]|nr:SHOCT domain-containing protein [Candidatus Binatia bacterium]